MGFRVSGRGVNGLVGLGFGGLGSGMLGVAFAMWEFPKIGDPKIVP